MADTPRTPPRRPAPALGSGTRNPGTPRRHKVPYRKSTQGTRPRTTLLTREKVKAELLAQFKLPFELDDWQAKVISHALRGYDGVFCAGTGYGKSLVFQGLAKLAGERNVVLVICPLKALEADQVREAEARGLYAVMINEDTSKTKTAWADARTKAQMVYISPEMVLSDSFTKLWADGTFRSRLQAVIIDEAHCVDEWGKDNFRKQYRQLEFLHAYTSYSVPFLACTATCSKSTFDVLWETLGFGYRPFWGIDVGCDRPNLLFDVRPIVNKKNPVIDILNILPSTLSADTTLRDIPKTILYFDSENDCLQAKNTLHKCLPPHLRNAVYAFSSSVSEKAKTKTWNDFRGGMLRILCATDAAGMGCNVPDIQYVVIVGCPRSLSVVVQRWGRAGRDRATLGTCIMLVPPWAFRPTTALSTVVIPALHRARTAATGNKSQSKTRKSKDGAAKGPKPETKEDAARRARLPPDLELFINLGANGEKGCAHAFLRSAFHPETRLTTFRSLDEGKEPSQVGERSDSSAFKLTWTVLDLKRHPPTIRCCNHCSPQHSDLIPSSSGDDLRLMRFAGDFAVPLAQPTASGRPRSQTVSTNASGSSRACSEDWYKGKKSRVPTDEKDRLRIALVEWRDSYCDPTRDYRFMSRAVDFPSNLITELVERCAQFLKVGAVEACDIFKIIQWDSASEKEVDGVITVITQWREGLLVPVTPASQRRASKKARRDVDELAPLPAPVFDRSSTPSSTYPTTLPGSPPSHTSQSQPEQPQSAVQSVYHTPAPSLGSPHVSMYQPSVSSHAGPYYGTH